MNNLSAPLIQGLSCTLLLFSPAIAASSVYAFNEPLGGEKQSSSMVPEFTTLTVKMLGDLDLEICKPGTSFTVSLVEPVTLDDKEILPHRD